MLTPHPPRPPYPPDPEPLAEGSDLWLAASLKSPSWAADPYPLAALLGRHWEPVYDYAVLCAPSTGSSAAALAAAAVHQVLRGLERSGPGAALRPRLLTSVRDIAAAWSLDPYTAPVPAHSLPPAAHPPTTPPPAADTHDTPATHDDSAGPTGDRTPARASRLALCSFQSLPPTAQCLLWHTAVEAEPVSFPAALLALDIGTALTELEAARGQFRSGLLRSHAELAAPAECRVYGRLLDAHTRRGKAFPPHVQHHLLVCPRCAGAAIQLNLFERRLGLLLAQAVLGRPAKDYLASRPGRRLPRTEPAAEPPREARSKRPGRHRLVPGALPPSPGPPARIAAKVLLAGVGLASAFTLGGVLTATVWPPASTGAGPVVPGSLDTTRTASGTPDAKAPPVDVPPDPAATTFTPESRPIAGVGPVDEGTRPLPEESISAVMRSDRG